MPERFRIRSLHEIGARQLRGLSDVLIDCVEGGAAVHFLLPLPRLKAEAFWCRVSERLVHRELAVLVAEDAGGDILGTVQVIWATPETQPHRAEIAKMLVHRRARRHGIGRALLAGAEEAALRAGKTLLVLDTATGSDAERLYARHGWQRCGTIPNYALWPGGDPCEATILYKSLGG